MRVPDSSNPLSEQFRRDAILNVTQNIASMRNQKELAREGAVEDDAEQRDRVDLARAQPAAPPPSEGDAFEQAGSPASAHGAPVAESGSQASEQSNEAGARGLGRDGGHGEDSGAAPLGDGGLLNAALTSDLFEEANPSTRRQRSDEARRLARDGVPDEILKASGEIVKGQLHPVAGPKASLREMKDVPEAAAHETAPESFAAEMDIAEGGAPLQMPDDPL